MLAVLALAGCAGTSPAPAKTASPAAHAKTAALTAAAISRCDNRKPAAGDVYVRMKAPGVQTTALELGDEWRWNYTTGTCQAGLQYEMAGSPAGQGYCTWAGYAADNPGYDVNATPAAPLKKIVAQIGGSC